MIARSMRLSDRISQGVQRTMPPKHVSDHRDICQGSWSILCDFDGTVAREDVVDVLLEQYGLPGWKALEQRWRDGHIGSRECMHGQVELLNVGVQELDAYLDRVEIDPAFPTFVANARARFLPVRIVSDGLDYAIRCILRRYSLDDLPIVANTLLRADTPGRWRLESPYAADGCRSGTCKCRQVMAGRGARLERTLFVGDGESDFCVASKVDLVFAKNHLIEHCRGAGIPYRPITGFADALDLLPLLTNQNEAPSRAVPVTHSEL